ncbi:MAG: hypothetical protein AB7N54_07420 [Alphaproteobacteria bacterium]
MTRIAPFAQQQLVLFQLLNQQQRMFDAQIQLATGKAAQTYSGIAEHSQRLLTVEQASGRAMQLVANIGTIERRLDMTDSAVAGLDSLASQMRSLLDTAVNAPAEQQSTVREMARNARAMAVDLLNARDGTRYLFGGARIDRAPVDLNDAAWTPISLVEADGVTVDDAFYAKYRDEVLGSAGYPQGSFYAQLFFDKNGALPTAPLPADPANPTLDELTAEDSDLWTWYVGRLGSADMQANPLTGYYQGDDTTQQARVSDESTVTYGARANEQPFRQLLHALDLLSNLPDIAPDEKYGRALMAEARSLLGAVTAQDSGDGFESLSELRVRLNAPRPLLDSTRERHQQYTSYAAGVIDSIEGIDPAAIVTRLQSDQTALEASYSTLVRLQGLSLVNFLR